MIYILLSIILLIFGLSQGYRVLFPPKKEFKYVPPEYSEYEKATIEKWNRIDEAKRRDKERKGMSRATEILKFEFLRRNGVISQDDFNRAKDDLINN